MASTATSRIIDPPPPAAGRPGVAVKRNPLMIGGGLLFALVAMLAGALLVNARGERRAVLVSAQTIAAGTVIREDMLRVERLDATATLRSIGPDELASVVGKTARQQIPAGVLIVPDAVAASLESPEGFVLLALVLEPGELPLATLSYGQRVDVVRTPVTVSADDPGGVIARTSVWAMWNTTSSQVTSTSKRALTLAVPVGDAVAVAQAAARHEIRLLALGGPAVWVTPSPTPSSTPSPTPSSAPSSTPTSSAAGSGPTIVTAGG